MLAETGVIGIAAIFVFLGSALWTSKVSLALGVGLCFATGTLLGWPWWCYVVILSASRPQQALVGTTPQRRASSVAR